MMKAMTNLIGPCTNTASFDSQTLIRDLSVCSAHSSPNTFNLRTPSQHHSLLNTSSLVVQL